MNDRRMLLGSALAALAAPLAVASPRQGTARPPARTAEHFIPGGTDGLQRAQYTFTGTSSDGDYRTIPLPPTPPIASYMIPLTVESFDESGGTRYQLQGDGCVTVMVDGLYELTANLDWPGQPRASGQDGFDTNLRKIMMKRVPVGTAPPVYSPGGVTRLAPGGLLYDPMALHDTPGSSAPNAVRTSLHWRPGTIAAGAMVYTDVAMPVGSFSPTLGDLARASHKSLSDALLGAANSGLLISARVVGPLLVRVMIENRYNAVPVTVPDGVMIVMAESAATSSGNSSDGWTYVGSGPVRLLAGEKIFIAAQSQTNGDYLQISPVSFMRISNLVA